MELSIELSFLSKSDDFDDKLLISQNMCIYTLNGNNCYDYFSNTMIQTIIIEQWPSTCLYKYDYLCSP